MAFETERLFDPRAGWTAGVVMWDSPIGIPPYSKSGLLTSFGENARRLVAQHFCNRLQIVVRPDDQTQVATCVNPAGVNGNADAQAVVQVNIMDDGPLGFGAAMYSGAEGSFEAHSALNLPGSLSGFATAKGKLNTVDIGEDTVGTVGVVLDQPAAKGWFEARSGRSLSDWGERFAGGFVLRCRGLQVGGQATFVTGTDLETGIRLGGDGDGDSDGATMLQTSNVSLRGVYTGVVPSRFASSPESFQLGLSLEESGRRVAASYFHNIEIRRSVPGSKAAREPQGLCFGGEYSQTMDGAGGASNEVIFGSSWQASADSAFKARLSSKGYADIMAATRIWGIHDLAPVINVAVTLGVDSTHAGGGVEPRTGLSLSIGE